jgi:hypothetical protein
MEVLSQNISGGTENNHEKPESGESVYSPRSESDTSRFGDPTIILGFIRRSSLKEKH